MAASLGACSSTVDQADSVVRRFGLQESFVEGEGFRHVIFERAGSAPDRELHIYIDGDGTPYARLTQPASDPTPHNPLIFRLMARDPAVSVYVGRPCYFALQNRSVCTPADWTTARYGPRVLTSMETVVRKVISSHSATRVELFGLSGGGVLAVLLAPRIEAVDRVVTVGSNLDIDAWCDLHHYSRLVDSINPVGQPALRNTIRVLHLVGSRDTNTPPSLVRAAAAQRGEQVRVVDDYSHGCCWEKLWPAVLRGSP